MALGRVSIDPNNIVSSESGYDLGPNTNGYQDLMSAYKALLQQQNATQNTDTQTNQSNTPDTTNWNDMNILEQGIHNLAQFGESISDPFQWANKYSETKEKFANGQGNVGDVIETGARFVGSLVPGMIGGLMTDPEKIAEAVTGNAYSESHDGKYSDQKLDADQRLATLGDAAIDVLSMVPAIAPEGRLMKAGTQVAKGVASTGKAGRQAAKEVGTDAFEEAAKNASKIGTKDMSFGRGLVHSMGQEAVEEGVQSVLSDIRGDQENHGVQYALGDNLQDTLARAGESAAFGALGGGVFHVAGTGLNYAARTLNNEASNAVKNGSSSINVDEYAGDAVAKAGNTYSSSPVTTEGTSSKSYDNYVNPVVAESIAKKETEKSKQSLGYSGTLVGNERAYGNNMLPSTQNIMAVVAHNDTKDVVLDGIFGDQNDSMYNEQRSSFEDAVARNDVDTAHDILNNVARSRIDTGNPIQALFYKQPATNGTPVKGYIPEFLKTPNVLAVDQALADKANADYDGDLATAMFDKDKLSRAKLLTESLIDETSGKSVINWTDDALDVHGWSEQFLDDVILLINRMCGMDQYGNTAAFNDGYVIEGIGDGKPMTLREVLGEISKIDDVDTRHAALARLFQEVQAKGFDVSEMWHAIQPTARIYQEVAMNLEEYEAAQENAVVRANQQTEGIVEVVQESRERGFMSAQNAQDHDRPTWLDFEEEAIKKVNSAMRGNAYDVFIRQGTRGDYVSVGDKNVRVYSSYERAILANLDMVLPGIHDNSKLMTLFNDRVVTNLNLMMKGKFTIGRDFDPSSLDEYVTYFNDEIDRYNSAINEMFFAGEKRAQDSPYYKPHVSIDGSEGTISVDEFMYGVLKDSQISELFKPLFDEYGTMFDDVTTSDGQNMNGLTLGDLFVSNFGSHIPQQFNAITKQDGSPSSVYGFLESMRKSAESIMSRQNKTLVDDAGRIRLKTAEELEAEAFGLDMDEIVYRDGFKIFQAFGEVVGPDALRRMGIAWYKDFANSREGNALIHGASETDARNAAWCIMFKDLTRNIEYALEDVATNGSTESVNNLMTFLNNAYFNQNPMVRFVGGMLQTYFGNARTMNEDGSVSYKDSDVLRLCASQCLHELDYFASMDKSYEEKMSLLDGIYNEHLNKDDSSPSIPWMMWLRAGMNGDLTELNIRQSSARVSAALSSLETVNAANMKAELYALQKMFDEDQLSDIVIMNVFMEMADNSYVNIDPEITVNELWSFFNVYGASIEKGQSVDGAFRAATAARMQYGQPFVTLFNQNTAGIGNSVNVRDFVSTRKMILDCLLGKEDPLTGQPFEIVVTDPETERDMVMNQQTMLGLKQGEKASVERIMEYLSDNPVVASWMKPIDLQMSRVGDVHSVGTRIHKNKSLVDSFNYAKDSLTHPKNSTAYDRRWRSSILQAANRIPGYKAMIVLAIDSPETITTPAEFRKRAMSAKENLDNWILSEMRKSIQPDYQAEGYRKSLEDIMFQRLDAVFNMTANEQANTTQTTENMKYITDQIDRLNDEYLVLGYMMYVAPDIKSSLSGEFDEMSKKVADSLVDVSSNQLMFKTHQKTFDAMLKSDGDISDPISDIKQRITFDDIKRYFNDEDIARAAYDLIDFTAISNGEFNNLVNSDFIMSTGSFADADGVVLDLESAWNKVISFCDNPEFAIEHSWVDRFEDQFVSAYSSYEMGDDTALRTAVKVLHKKAAIEHYKAEAARRDKLFDGDSYDMMRSILDDFLPSLKIMLQREHSENIDDVLGKCNFKEASMPEFNLFNPISGRAMIQAIDYQSSGDTEQRIGMEGQTPKFLTALGSLRDYSCHQGKPITVVDLESSVDPDALNDGRYSIEFIDDAQGEAYLGSGKTSVALSASRISDMVSNVDSSAQIVLIDSADQDVCTSGLCKHHAPNLIAFLQKTMNFGEEERTMKLKKTFHAIEDVIKGVVKADHRLPRSVVTGPVNPQSISAKWFEYVDSYAEKIKAGATDDAISGFGDIDTAIDWGNYAVPFAKLFVPCVKVNFKNGDTCSIGISQISSSEDTGIPVIDPIHAGESGKFDQPMNWNDVDSFEIRILSAEEVSNHITLAIDEMESDGETHTRSEYADTAEKAFDDWSSRNRYCQETDMDGSSAVSGKMTMDDVVGSMRYLSSSMHEPPVLTVLPASVNRYLGNMTFAAPKQLSSNYIHISDVNALNELKSIFPMPHGGGDYVSRIITDRNDNNDNSPFTSIGVQLEKMPANREAMSRGGFVSNSFVMVDYMNPMSSKATISKVFYDAASCHCQLLVSENTKKNMEEILNWPDDLGKISFYEEEINGETFYLCNPRGEIQRYNMYKSSPRLGLYRNRGDVYHTYLQIPGHGPVEDSMIGVTKEQARRHHCDINNRPVTYSLNTHGNGKPVMVDGENLSELRDTVDKLVQLSSRTTDNTQDSANRDMPDSFYLPGTNGQYNVFDLSSVKENLGDQADSITMTRILEYLNKVIENGLTSPLINVMPGDVIAIMRTGEEGGYKYYPVVHGGSVSPADVIKIHASEQFGGDITYRYSYSDTLESGGSIKEYLLDVDAVKAQAAQNISGSYKLFKKASESAIAKSNNADGATEILTYGLLHSPSMKSRLTPALEPHQVKLSLFWTLRQQLSYNAFNGMTKENVRDYFDSVPANFTDDQIIDACLYGKVGSVKHVDFWRGIASGAIKLKGLDGNQSQQAAIGRLIYAFLNSNTSPAFLFNAQNSKGNADEFMSDDWSKALGGQVRVDDVMAFCNWIDPEFCPAYNKEMTDEEFMRSDYFTDGKGRVRVSFEDEEGNKKTLLGYNRVTRVNSNGATMVRDISDSSSWNPQLQYLELMRNGVHGSDPKAAFQGMRQYLKRYSDQDIIDAFDDDPESYFKSIANGKMQSGQAVVPRNAWIYRGAARGNRVDSYVESMKELAAFYRKPVEIWSSTKDGEQITAEQKAQYLKPYRQKYGDKFSWELLVRLVEAEVNWTTVSSTNASNKMGKDTFDIGERSVRESMLKGDFPLHAKRFQIGDTTRIGVGAIEEYWLDLLCSVNKDIKKDQAIAAMRQNIKDAKTLAAAMPSKSPSRKSQIKGIEYMDLCINNKVNTTWLDAWKHPEELAHDLYEIASYMAGETPMNMQSWNEKLQHQQERVEAKANAMHSMALESNDIDAAHSGTYVISRLASRTQAEKWLENIVMLRQMNAMAGIVMPVANLADTMKGTAFQTLNNRLGQIGVGPSGHLWQNAIKVDRNLVDMVSKDKSVQDVIEARRLAATLGPEQQAAFNAAIKDPNFDAHDWLIQNTRLRNSQGHLFRCIYGKVMRYGSAAAIGKKKTARNFIENFQKVAGNYGFNELQPGGAMGGGLETMLASERGAANVINDLFDPSSPYNEAAEVAWNMTLQGSMAQENAMSWLGERITLNRSWAKWAGATLAGVPFYRATTNMAMRTLKNVVPGVSSTHYLLVNWIKEYGDTHGGANPFKDPDSPLAKILKRLTQVDPDVLYEEFKADADMLKGYTDLREAILVDLCHMTLPAFALVLAMIPGAIEPPEDDEYYDDYEEWLIFGQRISLSWWVKDLIGPILPWACWYKSGINGKASGSIMTNGLEDFLNMSPFLTANNAIQMITEPDSALDTYEETKTWYADSQSGTPEGLAYMLGSMQAGALSYASSILTPKIVTDIGTYMNPYEVSYNRKYVTDEYGNVIYNEDGTMKTEKVNFYEAQLRKITRNNFIAATFMNIIQPSGDSANGWLATQMPNQVTYDSNQMAFEHEFSVWDYDNNRMKSEAEQQEVCTAILTILDQNNDMDALYKEGFYLDKATKSAVSSYIWQLYQNEIDEYNDLVQSGETNYYVVGNGDYNAGKEIVSRINEEHYAVLSYYKNDLYYGKLCSDDLNQGFVKYNRYNTTFSKDASGNYYATGFDQRLGMLGLAPFLVAPQSGTAGNEGGWATLSAVTGTGMYTNDQRTEANRALEPVAESGWDGPTWSDLENSGSGSSSKTSSYGTSSGYGYGTRSNSGGSRSSRTYANKVSISKPYASNSTKASYTNGRRSTNSHNVNLSRPNLGNVLDAKRIYDADLDYLRPDFETKGSRQAYRRSDF